MKKSQISLHSGRRADYLLSEQYPHRLRYRSQDHRKEQKKVRRSLRVYPSGFDHICISNADAFVALTDIDEENLIMSMYAAYKHVPKVITKINRLEYTDVVRKAGIDRVISPKYIAANHIVRYVRGMQNTKGSHIKTLYRIMGKSAEVVEFETNTSTKYLGVPLMQMQLKKNILITTIVRKDSVIIPKGKDYSFIDSIFESVSGFTTTGASILSNIEALDKSMLFWRSFSHWIGGMGVLMFVMAILPMSGADPLHLMRAESPGPTTEKLMPKARHTAKILYKIYIGISLLEIIFLLFGGMPLFDSVVHTFGTAGTGGFSIKNASIGIQQRLHRSCHHCIHDTVRDQLQRFFPASRQKVQKLFRA